MKKCRNGMRGFLSLCAGAVLAVTLSGCVSNKTTNAVSVGLADQYFGTAGHIGRAPSWSGGVWSVTLDPATNYFSYNDIGKVSLGTAAGYTPLNGAFTTTPSGFLDLALSQGSVSVSSSQGWTGVGGYAVSLPGEGLLMRTGSNSIDVFHNSSSALIAATNSAACPAFTSPQTYNFVAQGTTNQGDTVVHVAYGSVEITPAGADSWSFSNFAMVDQNGNAITPSAIPDATCPATSEGLVLVSLLSNTVYAPAQITTGVSPSGLLIIDQGQNLSISNDGASSFDSAPTGPTGLMGVVKPSAALSVSDMAGKKYAGFESDPLSPLGTIAIAFGSTPDSGTAIIGGGFPSDDVTKTPRADTTLDLGAQSTQTPGLFTSVTLTQPDNYSVCKGTPSGGTDSNGNSICIYHGAAVAGQVNGKYVIFTNINDPTALNTSGATPLAAINLVLYQQ